MTVAALVLGALALQSLAPQRIRDALNPWSWGDAEWTSTVILGLILLSVWGTFGYVRSMSGHVDDAWEEVDLLRGEVGGLREEVHSLRKAVADAVLQLAQAKAKTDEAPLVVVEPTTREIAALVPQNPDRPTRAQQRGPGTAPNWSPRPAVPVAPTTDPLPLPGRPVGAPRGRHAAAED
jgi:hypothetical protein